jgi:Flp pilus assembly protein TadG
MRGFRKHRNREEGSNLVEMSLVLFILSFLLIGVADFGRAFNHYIVITNAAREGARYATRKPDREAEIKSAVFQEARNSGVQLSEDNSKITVGNLNATFGQPISVTVDYTFTMAIGGLVGISELGMRSSTQMATFGYQNNP